MAWAPRQMNDAFHEYNSKGKAAAACGDWAEAERWFNEALRLQPHSVHILRKLGTALVSLKKFKEAESIWQRAVHAEPQSADNQQMLGSVYMVRGALAAAALHLERALALNPAHAETAFKLARIAYAGDDIARAAEYFLKALAANPLHIGALAGGVQTLTELRRPAEAIVQGEKGLEILRARADIPAVRYNVVVAYLANAYRQTSDLAGARKCYRAVLAADPGDSVARHMLAAAEGDVAQAQPKDYARIAFDGMAATFDKHLVERLHYRAPPAFAAALQTLHGDRFVTVLDLGCGTGLMGEALKSFHIGKLVGIDISQNMLREADKRGLYGELICGDLEPVMAERRDSFDLIVAADVFIYIDDLAPIFNQAARLLSAGGIFAFSVEISPGADVELIGMGHFRHSKAYVAGLADACDLQILRTDDSPIRREVMEDVMGHFVYLTKPLGRP
jgi:predicted TPR repeat methyltransferase